MDLHLIDGFQDRAHLVQGKREMFKSIELELEYTEDSNQLQLEYLVLL